MTDETKQAEPMETGEGEDITPGQDGGVLKVVKREGTGEARPPGQGETVVVHYVGTLQDGSKFDSSRDRGDKFEFKLGTGAVIKAWDLGVATMRRGELSVFTCRADYAYGESGSPPTIPPNATLVFEVELFDWKGEDLSPEKDGGIERNILKKGEGYTTPNDGASCTVHIVGKYEDRVFEDRTLDLIIGEGSEQGVVEGVEHALQKFKKGEKSHLKVSSKYAYGQEGHPEHNIPGGATLQYEVELQKFEKAKEGWEMEPSEKLEQAEIVKNKGGNHFKTGKYKIACKYYKKIKDYLEHENDYKDAEAEKKDALLLAGHLNLAMCYLKMEDTPKAIKECDLALQMDADNIKGLFRRGQAYANRHDYELAKKDFSRVVELDATNKAAKNQLTIVNHKLKQEREKEKKTYAGMFSKFAAQDVKKSQESEKKTEDSNENNSNEQDGASEEITT